jgi:predicted permease
MNTLLQDLKYGLRMLMRSPGFAAVAVLTLALGIGPTTAIFSLVSAVLLRPLPAVRNPGQLVMLERIQKGFTGDDFGYPDYLDYRDRNRTFAGLLADSSAALSFSNGTTERILGSLVSGNYFSTLGVQPAIGRLIEPGDAQVAGEAPVAVLSYGFWQRAFGRDPAVVGRVIHLNGHTFTVVGVATAGFEGTRIGMAFDVWLPITMHPQAMPLLSGDSLQNRAWGWIEILGRLKPRVSPEEAQADLNVIAGELAQAYPSTNATRRVGVLRHVGMDSDDRVSAASALGLLMAVVCLLLLIACSNVANLLLARAAGRRREIAIRLALGAGRGRIVRLLLTEGLLLATLAGGAGLLLTPWLAELAIALQQRAFGLRQLAVGLDARVLAFAVLVSIATGVGVGLAPAARAWREDIVPDLKEGTSASSGRRSSLQSSLIVAQVALSLVLLVAAGLAARTLEEVLAADPGFETENRLLVSLDLATQGYSETAGRAFYDQLMARVRALPVAQAASLAGSVPPQEWPGAVSVFYEGQAPPPDVLRGREFELGLRVNINLIAPDYFRTLGILLLAGRDFSALDRADSPRVAMVSEALAHRLWPQENAIGKRLEVPFVDDAPQPSVQIVGVARDTLHRSLVAAPPLMLYLPRAQNYSPRATLVIHTAGSPGALLAEVRREIAALDKNVPIVRAQTLVQHVADSLWQQRLAAGLIGLFGVLALSLAAVGLYGVVSQSVAQRTREIGIRVTLGAKRGDILNLALGQGLRLTLVGIVLGLGASMISTRTMRGLIHGVSAHDPLTLTLTCVLLAAAALVACYLPARRATKVDPMVALHYE